MPLPFLRFNRSRGWALSLLATLIVACGLIFSLTGCSHQNERVLRIGTDATYPPLESVQNGTMTGFDIELGEAIGKELGYKIEWINTGFDGIFAALLAKKFDMVMSSVTITPERQARMAFSDPYYLAGQIVAVRDDETEVKGLGNLDGKRAGIQINTTASEVLKDHPQVTVVKYQTIDLALQDLENGHGHLDAVVGDAPTIRYFLAHGFKGLRTVGDMLTQEHYGVVMRPDNPKLVADVNRALAHLKSTGKYAALEKKYFGTSSNSKPVDTGLPWTFIFSWLGKGLLVTLGLTAFALVVGLPFGLLLALGRLGARPLALLCTIYVELWRGTPLLVQIIFIYYALPQLIGLDLPAPIAGGLALALNSAAYVAEIFRAGIDGVDIGQSEAARSLGLSRGQTLRFVVLPQALRRVTPPLTNEAIALLKDSSLVSVIGMAELTRNGQELTSQFAAPLAIWPMVALFYLLVTLPLSRIVASLEKRGGGR